MSATHAVVAVGCLIVVSVVAVVVAIRNAVATIEAAGDVIADTARAHSSAEGEHIDRLLADLWAHNEHLDRMLAAFRAPIDPRDAEMWARRVLDRDSDEWIIREVSQ